MKWRVLVAVLFVLAVMEAVSGVSAYSSGTFNWDNTEILTKWAAVRYVCLIYVPALTAGMAIFGGVFYLILDWALGDHR